jgi:hypothetical protein
MAPSRLVTYKATFVAANVTGKPEAKQALSCDTLLRFFIRTYPHPSAKGADFREPQKASFQP